MDITRIDELDGRQVADALASVHAGLVDAEVTEFLLVAQWAVVHNADSLQRPDAEGSGRVLPGTERSKRVGGLGTPGVAEFAPAELGCLIGRSTYAAAMLLGDVLDLQHRHPLLWQALVERRVRPWQAVPVARATRKAGLSLEQARWVDAQVAPYLGCIPKQTFEDLLEARIIEADPAAADARAKAAAMEQFVTTGRHAEYGLATLVARAQAGDVVLFVGMIDRLAKILALDGDTRPVGIRRATALGILANPARALTYLQRHAAVPGAADDHAGADSNAGVEDVEPPGDVSEAGLDLFGDRRPADVEPVADPEAPRPGSFVRRAEQPPEDEPWPVYDPEHDTALLTTSRSGAPPDRPSPGGRPLGTAPCPEPPEPASDVLHAGDLHPGLDDSGPDATSDPAIVRHWCPTCDGTGTVAGDPSLYVHPPRLDPRTLLPAATLYVHVSEASFRRRAGGVARMENHIGPITLGQAVEFLGHCHVTVKEVIDLNHQMPIDAYEIPARIREAVRLMRPRSVFPYSPNTSPSMDLDHPIPYQPMNQGGPGGQTNPYALAPLGRTEHRIKTHATGWQLHNPTPGTYLWRTPHGYWYRTDPDGTHPLGQHPDLARYGLDEHGTPTQAPTADTADDLDTLTGPSAMEQRFHALLAK